MDSSASGNLNDSTFHDRQKNLMKKLCTLEKSLNKDKNHESSYVPKLKDLSSHSSHRNKIRGFRGRQSIFKRPEGPAPRANHSTIPDYRKNPEKWTCYSLDDIQDMSNESNSQAAFSFLKELKQRNKLSIKEKLKINSESMEIDEHSVPFCHDLETRLSSNDKKSEIAFCKPQKKQTGLQLDAKPEFRNNKIIMPEYEVGTKKVSRKKNQRNKDIKIEKKKGMKLDHLDVYDDE